jgi:hypothetical protein
VSPHLTEVIFGFGHENIRAMHPTTLEITKEKRLSKKGDCIIAVATDKSLTDLSSEFRENLRNPNAKLTITIEAGGLTEKIAASGSDQLRLNHASDFVVRKSNFVCSRTLGIHADKAAQDFSRQLVEKLKDPTQKVKITLELNV